MSRKLTQEEFIRRAREVHKGKYSYDKVVYVNSSTKVKITCPIHGVFEQTPRNHLQSNNCPKCGKEMYSEKRKLGREQFIEKSKSIWGDDTLDYSKVVYKNVHTKVVLICKKHNIEFEQVAKSHLKKTYGCSECFLEKKGKYKDGYWSYEKCYEVAKNYEWLSDFRHNEAQCYNACKNKKHIKDFTWLKRHYNDNEDILKTKKHLIYGYFFPEFNTVYIGLTINLEKRHQRGHCRSGSVYTFCQENNIDIPEPQIVEEKLTLEESKVRECYWIEHYKTLGYELLNKCKGGSVGVLVSIKTGYETDIFISKVKKVHGNIYDYSKVEYVNSQTKVCIICPKHGEFYQTPINHLEGNRCRRCVYEEKARKMTKWTYETCKEESKKYNSRTSFYKGCRRAYYVSRKNGWLDEFFPRN